MQKGILEAKAKAEKKALGGIATLLKMKARFGKK